MFEGNFLVILTKTFMIYISLFLHMKINPYDHLGK